MVGSSLPGKVRITPSTEPSARAMIQPASATAMVQPRPETNQFR
jgi:hypothetical protein